VAAAEPAAGLRFVALTRRSGGGGGGILLDLPESVAFRLDFDALELAAAVVRLVVGTPRLVVMPGAGAVDVEAAPRELAAGPVWV
jgi:hypothetical protein